MGLVAGHKKMIVIFLILTFEHLVYSDGSCNGINCGSGSCITTANPSLPYYCKCSNGFNTILPCPPENPCSRNPCGQGTCETVPNLLYGYLCRCAGDIISLTNCNVTFNNCASNPCAHGLCVEGLTSFTCNCLPMWTGKTCDEHIELSCSTNLCGAGKCFDISDPSFPYVCLCPNGNFGISCSDEKKHPSTLTGRILANAAHLSDICNPLNPEGCMNGGKCLPTMEGYHCLCTASFTGRFCEIGIDPCTSNPCTHGGVCFDLSSSYICACPDGSFRSQCLPIEDSTVFAHKLYCPCQNGGDCTMMSSQPCTCPNGFTGRFCETALPMDGCGQIQCVNGGVCYENLPDLSISAYCLCKNGYTGKFCEIEYFQCQGNGRFLDQYNCANGKYFECIHYDNDGSSPYGVLLSRNCPATLRFNVFIDQCDYSTNVQFRLLAIGLNRIVILSMETIVASRSEKLNLRRVLEDGVIVYLSSPCRDLDGFNSNLVLKLKSIVSNVEVFIDPDSCADFIMNVQYEKIFWIVSDADGQIVIPFLHELSQIYSIYVLSDNNGQDWIGSYRKIKASFQDTEALCTRIRKDVKQVERQVTAISILGDFTTMDLNQLEPSFMYSHLLKEIILDMNYTDEAKDEFAEYCRVMYYDNPWTLNMIELFGKEYLLHSPVWWYTRDIFLYRLLNRALRTQDIDMIWKIGFYIKDLHKQLLDLYIKGIQISHTVYRGQSMLIDEFQNLKKNAGGLLAFNCFLSTTTDRLLAMGFAIGAVSDPTLAAIIFEIDINDNKEVLSPFALLNGLSFFESENEILFSMHSIFRIGEIAQLDNGVWNVKLILTHDDDADLRRLMTVMRRDVEGSTGLYRLGLLMAKMGEWDKAKDVYELLAEKTSDDENSMLASLHHQLGVIYYQKADLQNALIHYQKSLNISLKYLSSDALRLAPTYTNIGITFCKQGDLDRGIGYYQQALNIETKAADPNQEQIAILYNNIGSALQDQGQIREALNNYEQALQINMTILPENHPSLAIRYNNIGMSYYDLKDYAKALFNFKKCLNIEERSLPPYHPSLIRTNINLASTYENLHQYDEALKHAERTVAIARHCSHAKLGSYENYLEQCKERINSNSE
ncbi:unnamed protein product [Rotaria socialis]|uniref:Uncharacterized protein n=2 Tax=Rotaria socialis TaxID=392032 RepID=A0A820G6J7_9BILA|nr:unnamed protein product [Rotaria socialis]